MEKEQLQLRKLFFADCYNQEEIADDGFIQTIELINQKFGLNICIDVTSVNQVVDHIYENDDLELLKFLLLEGWCFDSGFNFNECPTDFERGDWTEESEDSDDVHEEYGEEGYDYYFITTKNKIFVFWEMRWSSNSLDYYGTEERKNL
jgi:hypothetical protein